MKLGVACLYAQEKAVEGRVRKALDIEDGMVRLWQPVQGQHSEHGEERGSQDGEFKGDRNERRPAIQRATPDVHWIGQRSRPVLEKETADAPQQASRKSQSRHKVAF